MAVDILRITGDLGLRAMMADAAAGKSFSRTFGSQSIPAMDCALTYGTSDAQCSWLYYASVPALAATTANNLDLSGVLTDAFGTVISATAVKLLAVAVLSPDGTKKVRVGPRGVTNANQLAFGGVASTDYMDVFDWAVVAFNPYAGFAVVNSSTDIIGLYNPGGSAITFSVLMAGK